MILRPYQQEAVNAVYEHLRQRDDNPCIVLPTGCHEKNHPILMFDGTIRKVQDIRVGDVLMGNDSTPRNVLALCRGRERMYRINPLRGESFVVNENHILSLVSTTESNIKKFSSVQNGGEITNISVREYLKKSKTWRHLRKLYRVPVDYHANVDLPIPPYILGLLLGDGCITNGVELTSADDELGDEFIHYANVMGCRTYVRGKDDNKASSYKLVLSRGSYNPVISILEQLGLYGHSAERKFIPHEYLIASRDQRLQLLAGLIDSDGYIDRSNIDYITKSQELAGDLTQLARSLGFMVTCREKYSSCQTGTSGWYFRLNISGDMSLIPFRRKWHQKKQKQRKQKKNVLRTGFTVEELPEDDFYGFSLDGNHLYVDGNFFVHHNTGKSLVLGQIATDAVNLWNGRVLVLAHVKELLEQNAEKIQALCPDLDIGIYSAGLNRRDTDHAVIVAGIQSVYKRACDFGAFDLVMIDECHLLSPDSESMYQQFLQDAKVVNPNLRVIGLTATPYRLKGGLICQSENILNHVCYEAGIREMIVQGYLSKLKSKAGKSKANLDGLHIRGGEFIASEMELAMDTESLVRSACKEIVELTQDRNSVLIFTTSVAHCEHVVAEITRLSGQECGIVTGDTPANLRAEILARFKGESVNVGLFGDAKPPLKFLANVNVLTTGFDATNVDCVVLLRPTASVGLYVQMVGRSTRLHPGKEDSLILDYGGNVLRHGPVDAVVVNETKQSGSGEAPAKECPECNALIHTAYRVCPECGFEFPERDVSNSLNDKADTAAVLSGEIEDTEYEVRNVYYSVHTKRNADESAPKTMRVEYQVGWQQYVSEWVCPEHTGWARQKFEQWWSQRSMAPPPQTAHEAVLLADDGALAKTTKIIVRSISGEQFDRVINHEIGDKPEYYPEPGWDDEDESHEFADVSADNDWFDDDDLPF